MSICAVVPLKRLSEGKRRLSPILSPEERAAVVREMARHVFSILAAVNEIATIYALTNESSLVPANSLQLRDPGPELNAAVSHAGETVKATGATSMLVIAGDLPFVTCEDIRCMISLGRQHPAVFAADAAGLGTNAILMSPPTLLRPSFGDRSLSLHLATAGRLGISASVIRRTGLARDVDKPSDLDYLPNQQWGRLVG